MRASRSLIVNPIAGDTLVIDLESLAFKGRWILPNLVGGVDQMRDIDRAVLLKKSVTTQEGGLVPPEWAGDALLDRDVERHAAGRLNDFAQPVGVDAVLELGARVGNQRCSEDRVDAREDIGGTTTDHNAAQQPSGTLEHLSPP